jgi:hypothetical protein
MIHMGGGNDRSSIFCEKKGKNEPFCIQIEKITAAITDLFSVNNYFSGGGNKHTGLPSSSNVHFLSTHASFLHQES